MELPADSKYHVRLQSIERMIPQISIVVPVYQGEKFLSECIESILNQTHTDFELILLDDGSTDQSGRICDEYAAKDGRVSVIHKPNEGINATRRRGVAEAKGEWIAFCDDDDSLPADALDNLYRLTADTDMVIGFPDAPNYHRALGLDECRKNMITGKLLPPSPWGKLYRRALLTDDIFDFPREIDGEEDMIMNIRLMFKTARPPHICFHKVYNFRRNTASVSHTKKASLDHEQAFDEARRKSIPGESIHGYMKEIIWSRFNGLFPIAYADPQEIVSWEHPYLKQLRKDVTAFHYKVSLREWLLLHVSHKTMLKYCGFGVILHNFLRYRLGLNN